MNEYRPKRIQRKRHKGWRMPENTVYVGRPTKWGNPFRKGEKKIESNREAVYLYKRYLKKHPEIVREAQVELRGRDLACWCNLDEFCHADILLEVANR